MLDAFAKVISQADARGEYLSSAQLDALSRMVKDGNKRMDVVSRISNNASKIVTDAARVLFAEQPQLIAPGGNAYTNRRMAACLRDMEIVLRYVTYAMFAGDASVLDDRCLNGLRETYAALGVPVYSMGLSIQIMRVIAIEIVSDPSGITPGDCSHVITELASYFDRAAYAIDGASVETAERAVQRARSSRREVLKTELTTREPWEISSYAEWLEQDKLTQKFKQYGAEVQESSEIFFEAWKRTPIPLKREEWCQRQVMAELYEQMMSRWRTIPGFRSVAIAARLIDGKTQLAGILVFRHPIPDTYYQTWNIPRYLELESPISSVKYGRQELVPILLEWESDDFEQNRDLIPAAPEITKPPPSSTILLQSGDSIAGRNSKGCLCGNENSNENSSVTLSTFVVPQNKEKRDETANLRLLSVYHGFELGYKEIHTCETHPAVRVGEIDYEILGHQEEIEKAKNIYRLDVALIKLDTEHSINPSLKWVEAIPKYPILGLEQEWDVQMYGGVSKHQVGQIKYLKDIAPFTGTPTFSVVFEKGAKCGDSGALLVTGNGTSGLPIAKEKLERMGYSEEAMENCSFVMLGILKEVKSDSEGNTSRTVAYFIPVTRVFGQLRIKPYLESDGVK